MKIIRILALSLALASLAAAANVVDLADRPLAPNSFYNGADGAGGFTSRGAFFNNTYDPQYQSWVGWSYSDVTNNTTPGYGNQYSAFPGGGATLRGAVAPGENYAVAYDDSSGFTGVTPRLTLAAPQRVASVLITNTTYAALTMRDGDPNGFAKKFGGASGNDADYFALTIRGFDPAGALLGSVIFFLADYRFANNSLDYIVDDWTAVDLTSLGANVKSLTFTVASSDSGEFGINTPAYFALDNLIVVPEPATACLLLASLGGISLRRRRRC